MDLCRAPSMLSSLPLLRLIPYEVKVGPAFHQTGPVFRHKLPAFFCLSKDIQSSTISRLRSKQTFFNGRSRHRFSVVAGTDTWHKVLHLVSRNQWHDTSTPPSASQTAAQCTVLPERQNKSNIQLAYSTVRKWVRTINVSIMTVSLSAFSALTLLVGYQEEHLACKNLSDGMLAWLCVWVLVQICIWPSWCHCHSLSPVNPDWLYLSGAGSTG